MFAQRSVGGGFAPLCAAARTHQCFGDAGQVRCAASLKAISMRIKAMKNLQKITKAMKMVAAAKLKHDEKRMANARPFSKAIQDLLQRLPREDKAGPATILSLTSDKGMCGGVNSAINKAVKLKAAEEEAKGNTVKILTIGAKGVTGLKRLLGDRYTYSFEEVSKTPWCFTTASIVAERIVEQKPQRMTVCVNFFRNMVAFDTHSKHTVTVDEAKTMDRAEFSKLMDVYSFEPSIYEVWDDLHEFYYASTIFGAYSDSLAAEQAARMMAMGNASKNAGEMIDKLTLQFNRARQAKITTELCEIISGAASV